MTQLLNPHINARALADQLAKQRVTVIDVREPVEYASGHIAGSRNVPLAQLGDANLPPHPQEAVASSHRVWTAL
ncbi:MAG: rhodanese-like domain-containing protein, partial [Cyanobacteriota bacterium]